MPRRGRRSRKKQASLADINQSPDMIELAAIAKQRRISAQLRRASLSKAKDAEEEGVTEDMWPPEPYPSEENWWVKSQWVVRWFVASQAWFDNFILLCIVVNCIFIAFSNPRLPQEHWQNSIGDSTEWFFNSVFILEMILKMHAFGLCRTNESGESSSDEDIANDLKTSSADLQTDHKREEGRRKMSMDMVPMDKVSDEKKDEKKSATANAERKIKDSILSLNDDEKIDIVPGVVYPPGYFRDGWNYIDFITVLFGLLAQLPAFGSFTFIRVIRVLRPLRTVKRVPQLRLLVNTVLSSFTELISAFFLLFFFMMILAIVGTSLFMGVLHQRCFNIADGSILDGDYSGPEAIPEFDLERICTLEGGTGLFKCPTGFKCERKHPNPFNGIMSWDSFPDTGYQVFQVSSLATWKETMFNIQDGYNAHVWIYFVLLILMMEFIGFNLILAKLQDSYDEQRESQEADEQAEAEAAARELRSRNVPESPGPLIASPQSAPTRLKNISQRAHRDKKAHSFSPRNKSPRAAGSETKSENPLDKSPTLEFKPTPMLLDSKGAAKFKLKSSKPKIDVAEPDPGIVAIPEWEPAISMTVMDIMYGQTLLRMAKVRRNIRTLFYSKFPTVRPSMLPLTSLFLNRADIKARITFNGNDQDRRLLKFISGSLQKDEDHMRIFLCLRGKSPELVRLKQAGDVATPLLESKKEGGEKDEKAEVKNQALSKTRKSPRLSHHSARRFLRSFERFVEVGFSWPSPKEGEDLPFVPVFRYYPRTYRAESVPGLTFSEDMVAQFSLKDWMKAELGQKARILLSRALTRLRRENEDPNLEITPAALSQEAFFDQVSDAILMEEKQQHAILASNLLSSRSAAALNQSRGRMRRSSTKIRIGTVGLASSHGSSGTRMFRTVTSGLRALLESLPARAAAARRAEQRRRNGEDSEDEIEALEMESRRKAHRRVRTVVMKKDGKMNSRPHLVLSPKSDTRTKSPENSLKPHGSNYGEGIHPKMKKKMVSWKLKQLDKEIEETKREKRRQRERQRKIEQKATTTTRLVENAFMNVFDRTLNEGQPLSESYIRATKTYKMRQSYIDRYPRISRLGKLVEHAWFGGLIMGCIIGNTVVLAWDHYQIKDEVANQLESANLAFTVIFTVEMVLKILGLGPNAYVMDPFNNLDALLVLLSLVELFLGGSGSASAFRAIRVLRLMKMLQHLRSMRALVLVISEAISAASWLMVLVCLFFFMFAIAGVQLFSGRLPTEGDEAPRWSFNNLWASTMTVFMMVTGDSWPDVVWDLAAAGEDPTTAQLFAVVIMLIGLYIVTNLFVAVLLSQFDQGDSLKFKTVLFYDLTLPKLLEAAEQRKLSLEEGKSPVSNEAGTERGEDGLLPSERERIVSEVYQEMRKLDDREHQHVLSKRRQNEMRNVRYEKVTGYLIDMPDLYAYYKSWRESSSDMKNTDSKHSHVAVSSPDISIRGGVPVFSPEGTIRTKVKRTMMISIRGLTDEADLEAAQPDLGPRWQLMGPEWTIRTLALRLATWAPFEYFIFTLIMLNCVFLAAQRPHDGRGMGMREEDFFALDLLFTLIFAFEMGVKIFGYGLIGGEHAYLSDTWDTVDGTVVLFMLLSFVPGLGFFRVFRALRPLRLLVRLEQPRVVLESLLDSVPSIVNVFLFCSLIFLTFAIFMISRFKGAMYDCEIDGDFDIETREQCEANGGIWTRFDSHFDDIGGALVTLFLAATTSGWNGIMYQCIDARGPDQTPQRDYAPAWGIFFIAYIFITAFFALNLLVGVLIDNFRRLKELNEGSAFLTEAQRKWVRMRKILSSTTLTRVAEPERMSVVRRLCFDIVGDSAPRAKIDDSSEGEETSILVNNEMGKFDQFILVCIILNTIVLAIPHYQEPEGVTYSTFVINFIFTIIFVIESILKIIAWKFKGYWRDPWNKFDLIIATLSFVGLFLGGSAVGAVRTFRILRVARSVRLAKKVPGLARLFKTLMTTIPSIFNIGMLMVIFLFMFAILGRQIFFQVERTDGGFSANLNYETVPNAMLCLWIAMTGDAWEEQMYGATREGGTDVAPLYFILFMMIMAFVMIELFLAAILENFENAKDEDDIAAEELSRWRDCWQEMDPKGTGWLPVEKVVDLVLKMPPPLGCGIKKGIQTEVTPAVSIQLLRKFKSLNIPLYQTDMRLRDYGYYFGVAQLRSGAVLDRIMSGTLDGKDADTLAMHLKRFGRQPSGAIDFVWMERKKKLELERSKLERSHLSKDRMPTSGSDPGGFESKVGYPSRAVSGDGMNPSTLGAVKESGFRAGSGQNSNPSTGRNNSRANTQKSASIFRPETVKIHVAKVSQIRHLKKKLVETARSQVQKGGYTAKFWSCCCSCLIPNGTEADRKTHQTDSKTERSDNGERNIVSRQWVCQFKSLLDRLAALRSNINLDSEEADGFGENITKETAFQIHDWYFFNVFLPLRIKRWKAYKTYTNLWEMRLADEYDDPEFKSPAYKIYGGGSSILQSILRKDQDLKLPDEISDKVGKIASQIRDAVADSWRNPMLKSRMSAWWKKAQAFRKKHPARRRASRRGSRGSARERQSPVTNRRNYGLVIPAIERKGTELEEQLKAAEIDAERRSPVLHTPRDGNASFSPNPGSAIQTPGPNSGTASHLQVIENESKTTSVNVGDSQLGEENSQNRPQPKRYTRGSISLTDL